MVTPSYPTQPDVNAVPFRVDRIGAVSSLSSLSIVICHFSNWHAMNMPSTSYRRTWDSFVTLLPKITKKFAWVAKNHPLPARRLAKKSIANP